MKKLENMNCIITGAGCVISEALAFAAAEEGAFVLLMGKNQTSLKSITDKICEQGGKGDYFLIETPDEENTTNAINNIKAQYGAVQGLINLISPYSLIIDSKDSASILDETLLYCRLSRTLMEKTGGAIVNIVLSPEIWGLTQQDSLWAVSGGMLSLTKKYAVEYAPWDIRVNALSLGVFKTEQYRDLRSQKEPEFEKKLLRHIPLNRLGKPHEAARSAMFLLGSDSSYITGAVLPVDGGYSVY